MDTQPLSMDNQILYKLGGIESQVASIRDDITKVVRRLEERMDDDRIELERVIKGIKDQTDREYSDLKEQVNRNEKKIALHDEWIKAWGVRSAMVLAFFSVFWLLAGGFILERVGTWSG